MIYRVMILDGSWHYYKDFNMKNMKDVCDQLVKERQGTLMEHVKGTVKIRYWDGSMGKQTTYRIERKYVH